LNGRFVSREDAHVSADDRGFTFGDGVYEFTPFYDGRPFRLAQHVDRLGQGLAELAIAWDVGLLEAMQEELIERNGLAEAPLAGVYVQVTRGSAPRNHAFPAPATPPTVYATAAAFGRPSASDWETGATAITVPDSRWGRVDVKTLQLLPNVLAQENARRSGADEAIFVRDGIPLEGVRNNLFAVVAGTLRTHPTSNHILPGVSREVILALARAAGYDVQERPTSLEAFSRASEVFLTGSRTEVKPIVRIDGKPVGTGKVGPVARALYGAFLDQVARECGTTVNA
jgi:D-alanine transaminase